MSVIVRLVSLSPSANALLLELALKESIDPNVYGSLVLECAIRERHQLQAAFAAAAAKVLHAA